MSLTTEARGMLRCLLEVLTNDRETAILEGIANEIEAIFEHGTEKPLCNCGTTRCAKSRNRLSNEYRCANEAKFGKPVIVDTIDDVESKAEEAVAKNTFNQEEIDVIKSMITTAISNHKNTFHWGQSGR